jgi:chromosome segregation ATPase
MEYFKQASRNWIIRPLQLVLDPSSQDEPKVELKEKLEELLRNVLEVQTAIPELNETLEETSRKLQEVQTVLAKVCDSTSALIMKEKLELVLDPSSQDDPIDELKEKLDKKFPEVQTAMSQYYEGAAVTTRIMSRETAMTIAAIELKHLPTELMLLVLAAKYKKFK